MIISTITKANLEPHELGAIRRVAEIECPHTRCEYCDLHTDEESCIIDLANWILAKFDNERSDNEKDD